MIDFNGLNDNQVKAVNWGDGPLLVLAGPGSGKTRVLTMRIAKIIEDHPDERFRVLGLTFTNKAASEMRARVEELVPEAKERTLLSTFHSFCTDVLRQHGSHIGLKPDFAILTQAADQEGVLADAIAEAQSQGYEFGIDARRVLPIIDKLLSNCIQDEEVVDVFTNKDTGEEVSILFKEYKKQLVINNRLDFSSILYLSDFLLKSKPRIAKQIRILYPYVCVDEFQDTNLAQYRILRSVVGDGDANIFVVADDDQIIYQWNGASPERLQELKNDYSMEVIQLPANYRCPGSVITIANNLIAYNLDRSPEKQPLEAMKAVGGSNTIRLNNFDSFDEEIEWVAEDIKSRPKSERSECVVLARNAKLLREVAESLTKKDIPAHLTKRKSEFESVPLRWLHSMLRLANARHDREQLRRVCKNFFSLEGLDIRVEDVVIESSLLGGDFLRAWFQVTLARNELESETKTFLTSAINQIVDKLDFLSFIPSAFEWIFTTEQRFGKHDSDVFVDYPEEKEMWHNLQRDIADKFGRDEVTLHAFLQEIDLSPKAPLPPSGSVQCLTIHSSKGMEFNHVYLIGLAEDQLPSFQSKKDGDDSREMQEERRNCFVALTRCQETLTLTYADRYFGWGKSPSRFLYEMGLLQ
jgi:DNA helicase II / ATP-dependent DNA helicase PcrA